MNKKLYLGIYIESLVVAIGAVVAALIVGIVVVAEGIENVRQLERLRRLGCEYGQGYLFSRPLPVSGIDELLADTARWTNLLTDSDFHGDVQKSDYSSSEFTN